MRLLTLSILHRLEASAAKSLYALSRKAQPGAGPTVHHISAWQIWLPPLILLSLDHKQ